MKKLKFLQALLFILAFFSCSLKKEKIQNPQKIKNYAEFNKIIPERIVSLSPAATELLAEAGAISQIAARTDFCDYPQEVLQIESVGGFDGKSISQEKLLSFSPDLVCLTSGMHDYLTEFLENQKINFYILSQNSVSMILNDILTLGEITGNSETAQKNVQKITRCLNKIKSKTEYLPKVSVYWEIWDSPLMSIGKISFIT
ncbi:MAG: ABC transporter substrate-binding protein, partial [Spirochaetia bacterium]|nr:ABC transporter substrate-binding protein [Spirochaetia bacterium]